MLTRLRRRAHFEIDVLPPFNFRLTVRKPAGWSLFTSEEVYEEITDLERILPDIKALEAKIDKMKSVNEWVENRIAAWQAISEEEDVDMLKEVMVVPPTSVEIVHAQADTAILELQELLRRIGKTTEDASL